MKYHVHINKKQYFFCIVLLFLFIILSYLYVSYMPKCTGALPLIFPDCMFKQIFHLYCPGCGGTRSVECLFHLQPVQSCLYHPMVIYIVICLCFFYIKIGVQLKRQNGVADFNISTAPLWGLLFLLILFFIGRNILLVCTGFDYIGELSAYWNG